MAVVVVAVVVVVVVVVVVGRVPTLAAALDSRMMVSSDRAVTGRFFWDCLARMLAYAEEIWRAGVGGCDERGYVVIRNIW